MSEQGGESGLPFDREGAANDFVVEDEDFKFANDPETRVYIQRGIEDKKARTLAEDSPDISGELPDLAAVERQATPGAASVDAVTAELDAADQEKLRQLEEEAKKPGPEQSGFFNYRPRHKRDK